MEEFKVAVLFLAGLHFVQSQTTLGVAARATTRRFPQTTKPPTAGPHQGINAEFDLQVISIAGYAGQVGYSWNSGKRKGPKGLKKTDCAQQCNALAGCQSFDYNSNHRECWIHEYNTCDVSQRLDCGGCLHYKKNTLTCVLSTQYFSPGVASMHNLNGQAAAGKYPTVEACLQFCHKEATCVLVEYNSADQMCWWHTQSTACNAPRNCAPCSVTQYRHNRGPCQAPLTPTQGTPSSVTVDPKAGNSYDAGKMGVSHRNGKEFTYQSVPYECNNKCSEDLQCQGFDLNTDQKKCWFHDDTTICTQPQTNCARCIHYKNKRAICYTEFSVPATTTTTTAPIPTTPEPLLPKFPIILMKQKIKQGGTWDGPAETLEKCLIKCDTNIWCEAVDYDSEVKVCLLHRAATSCAGTDSPKPNSNVYRHARVTCGKQIFNDFTAAQGSKERENGAVYSTNLDLAACLERCKTTSTCTGVNYKQDGLICEHISIGNQCSQIVSAAGFLQYDRKGIACTNDPVFQDYKTVQSNKRILHGVVMGKFSIIDCLRNCRSSSTCVFINYRASDLTCEHGSTEFGCLVPANVNGWVLYRKNTHTCPGDPTTTTKAPKHTPAAVTCWNKMIKIPGIPCTKPVRPSPINNMEDIEPYCRLYNTYFTCVIINRRSIDCPNVARDVLATYVNTLEDLQTKKAQFCDIFKKPLQTCLRTSVVPYEISQCEANLKPTAVDRNADIAKCQKLRDYVDCVQSVVDYRCMDHGMEFRRKSTRYILSTSFSNCDVHSSPLVISVNTQYGPAAGASRLVVFGNKLLKYGAPTIFFGYSDSCQTGSLEYNASQVVCATKNVQNVPQITLGVTAVVRLRYASTNIYFTIGNFTYKHNPSVSGLNPSRTVIGGGTTVTVNGTYLIYVVEPVYEVIRILSDGTRESYTSVCKQNPDDTAQDDLKSLTCVVPEITLPAVVQVNAGKRVKNVWFWNGMRLDGEQGYANLTLAGLGPSDGDRLFVYGPPEIDQSPTKVYEFKAFWPVHQTTLELSGRYLNTAATARDYKVFIGPARCTNVRIISNKLTCDPPKQNPYGNGTSPPIIVKAPGANDHRTGLTVGKLHYQTTLFQNTAGLYGFIGAAVGTFIILIILIVICCCCCACCPCSNRNKDYDSQE